MTLLESLDNKNALEHAILKCAEYIKIPMPLFYEIDGLSILIMSVIQDKNMVDVELQAYKDSQPLKLEMPFRYLDPPIRVPDGTFTEKMNSAGDMIKVDNFKVDVIEALKIIVRNTIKITAGV